MFISHITPTQYIKDYQSQGDFILALSHLIKLDKKTKYEEEIMKLKLPIWLDNGTFENGIPEDTKMVYEKAKKINAKLMVAPDYLYDYQKTKTAINEINDIRSEFKIMVVCQAKDKEEYIKFYKELCNDFRVSIIGLSILAIPYVYKMPICESRIALMKDLLKLKINHKQCHLLGLGDSYRDVVFAKDNCPWIKSNDSSSCFWNGIKGNLINYKLDIEGGKTKMPVDFNFYRASKDQLSNAQFNINIVKKYVSN